jgi:hypothetical protein
MIVWIFIILTIIGFIIIAVYMICNNRKKNEIVTEGNSDDYKIIEPILEPITQPEFENDITKEPDINMKPEPIEQSSPQESQTLRSDSEESSNNYLN